MAAGIEYASGLTISMPVADLDRSIKWYEDVLEFTLQMRVDDVGWGEMISPVADVTVGLSVVEKPNPGGATPTFGVQDIEAAAGALRAKGVRIDGDIVAIEGMVKYLSFFDPDENALMFFQLLESDN